MAKKSRKTEGKKYFMVTIFSEKQYIDKIGLENYSDTVETSRIFNSAVRHGFNLNSAVKTKGLKLEQSMHKQIAKDYSISSDYYTNSITQEAAAKYRNAEANKENHLLVLEAQIERIEDKLTKLGKALKNKESLLESFIKFHKALISGKKLPKIKFYKGAKEFLANGSCDRIIFGVRHKNRTDIYNCYDFEVHYLKPQIKNLRNRIKQISGRLKDYNNRLENAKKKKPSFCFGSRDLFSKQNTVYKANHRAWRDELSKTRNKSFLVSGRHDAVQGNFVFRYNSDTKELSYSTIKGRLITIKDVEFPYNGALLNDALNRAPKDRLPIGWMVEIHDGYLIFKASISIEEPSVNYSRADGVISIDINEDHLTWTELDAKGNLLDKGELRYNIHDKSMGQINCIIALMAKELLGICVKKHKPLVMEDLNLKDAKSKLLYNSKKLNRKLSLFACTKITEAVLSRARKDLVAVFLRNPAFTSQIGKIKYMKRLGVSVHTSAAYVIGRRGLNLKERVPDSLRKFLPENIIRKHHWAHWRFLSKNLKSVLLKYFYKTSIPMTMTNSKTLQKLWF